MDQTPVEKIIYALGVIEHNHGLKFSAPDLTGKPRSNAVARMFARRRNSLISDLPSDKEKAIETRKTIEGELVLHRGIQEAFARLGHRFAPVVRMKVEKTRGKEETRRILEIGGFPTAWAHTAMPLLEQERAKPRTRME